MVDVARAVIAQEVIQPGQGFGNVLLAAPVHDVEMLASMRVIEAQMVLMSWDWLRWG